MDFLFKENAWLSSVLVLLVVLYGALRVLEVRKCKTAATEPPVVYSWLPVFGHALKLFRYGVSYYRILREETQMPIVTLFLGLQKVYVVSSPVLISQINRRPKIIDSNPPFLTIVMGKLFDFPEDDMAELLRNPNDAGSLRLETRTLEHSLLERGAAPLRETYTGILRGVISRLNHLASGGTASIELGAWLREVITLSTAEAVFGPNNPFNHDGTLFGDFWEFESGLKGLTMGVFPEVTASGAAKSRHRLVQAFHSFVEIGRPDSGDSCELVQQIAQIARRHHRSSEYIARYYLGVFTAFLINTVPITFWTIAHIVHRVDLLARIRTELEHAVDASTSRGGAQVKVLDIAAVRDECPLLISTFRETLRYVSASTSTMVLHEDVWLDDRYFLTKGALVQIPATAVHSDTTTWGPDACRYVPERFCESAKGRVQVHPAANRTFGGGNTLCPGRHLASDEVLGITILFLSTFSVELGAKAGQLRRDETNMLSVMKPKDDLRLNLTRLEPAEKVNWTLA